MPQLGPGYSRKALPAHLTSGQEHVHASQLRLDYREHSPVGGYNRGVNKRWWGPGKGIILCLLWPPHQRLSHSLSPGGQLPDDPSPIQVLLSKLGTNTKYLFYSPWATWTERLYRVTRELFPHMFIEKQNSIVYS